MTQEPTIASSESKARTCACGHGREHHLVSPEGVYTISGYLRLFFGISARPTKVKYRCRRCNEVFSVTADPAILDQHY
ncbi:hypothetical protein [Polyangium mundeleinium]|uniref:Uncharacterized protein n=1 Tax=Polyangium mundeleinium TaxID=2995306 RepID=A0ABT5EKD2_9BACT|nr:hypothetical protein [Polyangium mundeleinium]MDC0742249.1 hypothetical protein [Polyangium mundeleinium]